VAFIIPAKKWIVTSILLTSFLISLVAYPVMQDTANYGTIPIISYQEAQNYEYTILEEGGDYIIIEINGEDYYMKLPSN